MTFILKKDTLIGIGNSDNIIPAGTKIDFDCMSKKYISLFSNWWFSKEFVENNPEWFGEKEEKLYTEEDMRRCFNAAKPILDEELASIIMKKNYNTFYDYLKAIQRQL